jgi:CheY-like chemotaxis protein
MVIEDDADIRDCVYEFLTAKGYQVHPARHGREALDKLPTLPRLCIIIVDLLMPVMDGVEFIRQLRAGEHQPNAPVLIMSASSTVVPPEGTPVVRKPVGISELLQIIETTSAPPVPR